MELLGILDVYICVNKFDRANIVVVRIVLHNEYINVIRIYKLENTL